ncbi:putative toxin-antitoxin system toxin component, PIN family [Nodosilinea sp. LEGE 07088]|uniref:putative toxin-antitoxin system toxin component, PIN family n=1 Tax=Nodosilinea sp. LEGE 07088 TaxID=2777968 RepID=UPI001D143DA0|nr:putative toxin-antitoxin system toxin component, PIN family [Nodosilinea sp. LEGE 07088]
MRFVFDTNTVISALLFKDSVPGRALYFVLAHGTILISSETIELMEVINRRKFDKYLTNDEREDFLESLLAKAELVEVSEDLKICRDPKDDKFLNLASNGEANFIVTGDDDLLILKSYRGIQILNARDVLELFAR